SGAAGGLRGAGGIRISEAPASSWMRAPSVFGSRMPEGMQLQRWVVLPCRRLQLLAARAAQGGLDLFRRVVHERLAQLRRRLEDVRGAREDDAAGALGIDLWVVDAGRDGAVVAQGFGGLDQGAPDVDHHRVAGAQVLVGAVVD